MQESSHNPGGGCRVGAVFLQTLSIWCWLTGFRPVFNVKMGRRFEQGTPENAHVVQQVFWL